MQFFDVDTYVKVCRTVKKVLRKHYSQLKDVTESWLQNIADKMYAKEIINREVLKKPTFHKIEQEFSAALSILKDETVLEEMCSAFLCCLVSVGGPAKNEAIALANDWKREVLSEHKLQWSFVLEETEHNFSDSNFEFSSEDKVAVTLTKLHKSFPSLFLKIRMYYDECGLYKLKNVARWISDYLGESGLTRLETFDDLFDNVRPSNHFLNCDLIEALTEEFPVNDKIQSELNDYIDNLKKFEGSTEIKDMKFAIKKVPLPKDGASSCKITIKLTGKWKNVTVDNLWKLMRHLFGRDKKRLSLIDIDEGSITVVFMVPSSLAQSLIDKVQGKVGFMHHLGMFQLVINSQTLLDRDEDVNFNFEDSLLHVIKHIDSEVEYERIALLLTEFEVALNYQNAEHLQTALMLASEGGHIEVFMSLLSKGADSYKLPEKEGHIGLNSLACTALSKHIHKSTGGGEIISQDGCTPVGDILERAVKERGVSNSFYKPFVSVIENKLNEKVQSLQSRFQALDNRFVDTANEVLVDDTSLLAARRSLQSYIEEEANCNNVHQLLQLLQPHYSFLHVNLLNVMRNVRELLEEQVVDYNSKLEAFKSTTTLIELTIMSRRQDESQYLANTNCMNLTLKLSKAWGCKTIAQLNILEACLFLPITSILNLIETRQDNDSGLSCIYIIPPSQAQRTAETIDKQRDILHKIGMYEVLINEIPVMTEDKAKSFTFEDALQKAHQDNDEDVIVFMLALNITLPSESPPVNVEVKRKDDEPTQVEEQSEVLKFDEMQLDADQLVMAFSMIQRLLHTSLITFCKEGRREAIEKLLNKDLDINFQTDYGRTALMFACYKEHIQIVQLLCSKNPDMDVQDSDGWTALMFACCNGNHQVVRILLDKEQNINIRNNAGSTALMCACHNGHHQVVELLVSKNPDIDIQSNNGWSALLLASDNGHHLVVEQLLSKDQNINIQNKAGSTALISACHNGHHRVVELLLSKNPNMNIQRSDGSTALISASHNGHHQIVELLLSKNPGIDIQSNDGSTALMYACHNGHHQVAEILLNNDPDIDLQDNNGATALMSACYNGHYHIVELLLHKNPGINIQDLNGLTALMFACHNGYHQIVELLLSKDPDINIQTNDGWTSLMFASCYGHQQVVRLLLSENQNINIQDNDGLAALMLACQNGHFQVVESLLSKDPYIDIHDNIGRTALMYACCCGHHQVVEILLDKNPDINIQNNEGMTALTFACVIGHHQIVELLLSKDADPSIHLQKYDGIGTFTIVLLLNSMIASSSIFSQPQSKYLKILELLLNSHPNHFHTIGSLKLHSLAVAAFVNNLEAVKMLMKKCDLSTENIISAFSIACYEGHSLIMIHLCKKLMTLSNDERKLLVAAVEGDIGTLVSMLFEVGMSPDTPLVGGITPLMIAASCGHIEILDTLIQAGADVNKTNDEEDTALDIAKNIKFYDRENIIKQLVENTPADKPHPGDKKQTNLITTALRSIYGNVKSFVIKACNPTYMKHRTPVASFGASNASILMTANRTPVFVSS